jgi:hypothetical protein
MTTQDIYAWIQMGLQIVIGGGIVIGISRYFGILRKTIDVQAEQMKALKATIEAQSEQIKAQSTVLQDFERLNNIMKHVLDTPTVSPLLTPIATRNFLLYQSLPTSVRCRHANWRRRNDDTSVGTAARGIVE